MERFGGPEFTTTGCTARKKRSNTPRRPRTDSHPLPNSYNFSPNDQNAVYASKKNRMDNGAFGDVEAFSRIGSENKLKKVKLKLGGITRTIHTNSTMDFVKDEVSFPINGCYSSDALRSPTIQENIDTGHSCPLDVRKSSHGVPPKDFSTRVFGFGDNYSSRGKTSGELFSAKEAFKSDSVRKSRRVPKRRVLDVGFSDEEDDEIRYLGRLNASKVGTMFEDEEDDRKRSHRNRLARLERYSRMSSTSDKTYEDVDYMEEEELTSDDEPNVARKTLRKESIDLLREGKKEITPNHPNKDNFSGTSETVINLPTDSLSAPRKKQKEKLSEVEQQLKKAEAAQRRRLQSEKAAREAEAEAIRKILGQDSARKKREEKIKKQRDEIAQGKAASSMRLAPSTVRWVRGLTGTIVTFSEDIGLPSIFNSMPCSYPPQREKCVGPNCTNSYKYRDSKSKLPLCSLLCYRAIHKECEMHLCRTSVGC